jgi:tetratricopeptide (TPR) repeat protein
MRHWIAATLALALFAAGCASSSEAPASGPGPATPAPAAMPAGQQPQAPPRTPQTGAEWDEILNKLKATYEVTEQQKNSQADEHYRLAERYYQAGDFEKATLECEKALQLNSSHAPSKALFHEIQFIIGREPAR